MEKNKYKTGLVLSGGGARGFAHLGVIQALNEAGIFPEVISGTSSGAIAGVLYCDGYKPMDILAIMKTDSRLNYMRPTMPRYGILQISGIARILESHLRAKTFEDLKLPLYVATTNLNYGRIEYFSSGELIMPIIASSSIPVLFKPVIMGNDSYVDGGVMDNLPIKPIEDLCSYFIGSFVNPSGHQKEFSGLIDIAERTFILNLYKEALEKSKNFDLYIAPAELRKFSILSTEKAEEVFNIGYEATKTALDKTGFLKALFPQSEKENKQAS